jgi:hypothetical protein
MLRKRAQVCMVVTFLLISSWICTGETWQSQATDTFNSKVALVWFDTLYDLVKTEQITPPVASRIYGVVAVAGIRLTRDSWDTTGVTQKRPECPSLEATTLEP